MSSQAKSEQGVPPAQIDLFTSGIVHRDTYPEIDPATKSDCTGKSVLVTGASRGLGRAMAVGYAQAGASLIAVAARSDLSETTQAILAAAKTANRAEPTVLALAMDVCDVASVRAAAARLEAEWGGGGEGNKGGGRPLDILISNAGFMAPYARLCDTDDDEAYMRTWDVNYWGTYRVCKAFLPLMIGREGGDRTIITISSLSTHFTGIGGGAYSISKFALIRLTQFIQDEYRHEGVLAYSVHPGGSLTALSENLPEKLRVRLQDTPELAAHSIPFLTSRKRDWLGGRWVTCVWDMPELLRMEDEIVEKDLLKFRCAGL